jgi:hypothetical protein
LRAADNWPEQPHKFEGSEVLQLEVLDPSVGNATVLLTETGYVYRKPSPSSAWRDMCAKSLHSTQTCGSSSQA